MYFFIVVGFFDPRNGGYTVSYGNGFSITYYPTGGYSVTSNGITYRYDGNGMVFFKIILRTSKIIYLFEFDFRKSYWHRWFQHRWKHKYVFEP